MRLSQRVFVDDKLASLPLTHFANLKQILLLQLQNCVQLHATCFDGYFSFARSASNTTSRNFSIAVSIIFVLTNSCSDFDRLNNPATTLGVIKLKFIVIMVVVGVDFSNCTVPKFFKPEVDSHLMRLGLSFLVEMAVQENLIPAFLNVHNEDLLFGSSVIDPSSSI